MAKKVAKKVARKVAKAKNTLVRSSSIDKTITEGREFVQQSSKVIKKKEKQQANWTLKLQSRAATNTRTKPSKAQRKSSKAPKRVKKAARAQPKVAFVRTPPVARTGNTNLNRTSSKNSQVIEQELHDRLTKNKANIGKLNFSLRWWDPNDLDLHVECPCGTHIFYGQKKCNTCQGELDIDMNVGSNMSLEPVEHIFFKNPKKGLYKFSVRYSSGPKLHQGVTGGIQSDYTLSLHEDYNQIFRYEDKVSQKNPEIHYDFTV